MFILDSIMIGWTTNLYGFIGSFIQYITYAVIIEYFRLNSAFNNRHYNYNGFMNVFVEVRFKYRQILMMGLLLFLIRAMISTIYAAVFLGGFELTEYQKLGHLQITFNYMLYINWGISLSNAFIVAGIGNVFHMQIKALYLKHIGIPRIQKKYPHIADNIRDSYIPD